jgi:hypothetical protein
MQGVGTKLVTVPVRWLHGPASELRS